MRTILIADEDIRVGNMVRLIFTEHMGYRVVAVVNGTDAILKAKGIKPDVVLLDISLSNYGGYKVLREIKTDPILKNTSVILFSKEFETFNRAKALPMWADDIVTKPFEPEVIIKKVERLTRQNKKNVKYLIKVHEGRRKRMETKFVEVMISIPVVLMITVPILFKTFDFDHVKTESKSLFSYERGIKEPISDVEKAGPMTESYSGLEQPYGRESAAKVETGVSGPEGVYSEELKTEEVREKTDRPKGALNEEVEVIKYVIKRGDTLWDISNRFNTSIKGLKAANNLIEDMIYAEDILIIPAAEDKPGETQKQGLNGNEYTIRKGDTLWGIANRFNTSVKDLKLANKPNGDTIYAGDILVIPAVGEAQLGKKDIMREPKQAMNYER